MKSASYYYRRAQGCAELGRWQARDENLARAKQARRLAKQKAEGEERRKQALRDWNMERRGFTANGIGGYYCTQCQAMTINGIACHETGCPNTPGKCFECGGVAPHGARLCEDCAASLYVEKHIPSGSWLLSAIVGGQRKHKQYIGYTKREALRLFRKWINGAEG